MNPIRSHIKNRSSTHPRGSAAVEAAIVLPLLVLVTFGAIDIAQYINLAQMVTNASREGARIASRNDTETVQEVRDVIVNYMSDVLPQLSQAEMEEAIEIEVRGGGDLEPIADGNLDSIDSGDMLSIRVSFDFSVIRWINGFDYWNGNAKESLTFCRRN